MGIATTVTLPVLVAVLATISGILIVGVGGGLIKPMQSRWEQYLQTASVETQNIKTQVAQAPSPTEQAKAAKARYDAEEATSSGPSTGGSTAATSYPGSQTNANPTNRY